MTRYAICLLVAGLLALPGCSPWKVAEKPKAVGGSRPATYVAMGDACVRETRSPELQRVINYTDPELCGRHVKTRPPVHLRVPAK